MCDFRIPDFSGFPVYLRKIWGPGCTSRDEVRSGTPAVKVSHCRLLRWLPLLALAGVVVAVGAATCRASSGSPDREAILYAIHSLENPRNLTRPGPRGELGPFQFRAGTWRMHTTLPFSEALDRSVSETIAIKHLEWLKRGLQAARMPVTVYNLALAWNSGLSATIRGKSPSKAHWYAERAVNLVSVYGDRSQQVADAR